MSILNFTGEVARGAELLDDAKPNWFNEINLDKFNMVLLDSCVLGQLYSSYLIGLERLGLNREPSLRYEFGFTLPPETKVGFGQLEVAWVDEIQSRLYANINESKISLTEKELTHWIGEAIAVGSSGGNIEYAALGIIAKIKSSRKA